MRNCRTLSLFLIGLAAVAGATWAERGDDANRRSKNGALSEMIDGVAVTVEYGRPRVNGRKIWGGLVPWDRVWRTGADEATTISFDRDVKIQGEALAAGRYAFFTIPGMESWTLIFNSTPDQWGAFSYDQSEDALRVEVESVSFAGAEELTFAVEDNRVILRWEKVAVPFTVKAAG